MSEHAALSAAQEIANKTGQTVYVVGTGNHCAVSTRPGTMCSARVLPTV